jgi:inner membrane protein
LNTARKSTCVESKMKLGGLGKVAAVLGVAMVLLIGVGEIRGVLFERMRYSDEAARSVEQSHAGRQTLFGPALAMHCTETWPVTEGEGKTLVTRKERREFTLRSAPRTLTIDGQVQVEPRVRGIYSVSAFGVSTTLNASWADLLALQPPKPREDKGVVQCEAPKLLVAVGDARGIRSAKLTASGVTRMVEPGSSDERAPGGFHVTLPELTSDLGKPFGATIVLDLAGIEALGFVPLGDDTRVALRGNWPHPSFSGRFLPATRPEVQAQGFAAEWRVSSLASNAQRHFNTAALDAQNDAQATGSLWADVVQVHFIDPVNAYSLTDRASKYALLFIALTFVAVGLFEVIKQLRVHPVQYLLAGSALAMFFLLLLSLSEHLPFVQAYAIAAAACVLLLTFYASYMLHGVRRGVPFGLAVATLYGALYVLLHLEDAALAVGSGVLFAALALVMIVTRKLDWYALFDQAGSLFKPAATSQAQPQPAKGSATQTQGA